MDWIPDLRQLRAFVAVAEDGSFTVAAKRISVTQSAVSHSLRALEDQLKCRLLNRSGKKVVVTAEGELLLKRSRRIFYELEQAGRDLDGLRHWGQTRIRLGAPHTLCHVLLPGVLREFRDAFPHCIPLLESDDTTVLLERLKDAELDLVVGLRPRGRGADGYLPLFFDRLAFLVSPFHPWVQDSTTVLETLDRQTFIIDSRATETHRLFLEWLELRGERGGEPLALGDTQAIKEMARLGIGVAVVAPWVAAKEIDDGSLREVALDHPGIQREWGVFHSPERQPSLVEQVLIGLCEMAFGSLRGKSGSLCQPRKSRNHSTCDGNHDGSRQTIAFEGESPAWAE